jgi:hypothetical protein
VPPDLANTASALALADVGWCRFEPRDPLGSSGSGAGTRHPTRKPAVVVSASQALPCSILCNVVVYYQHDEPSTLDTNPEAEQERMT